MKKCLIIGLTLLLIFPAGCRAPEESPAARFCPPEEQRLVVYTSHKEEVWHPIIREFEERTGIWVEVVEGGSSELLERLSSEQEAPVADVMFGGGVEGFVSYADCFSPYTTGETERLLPRFREPQGLWTPFSSLPVVLVYHTRLVSPRWVTSWRDILSPMVRGRVAIADPAVSGSSLTGLMTLIHAMEQERSPEETLLALANNLDGKQLESSGEVLSAVADGSFWVGVTLEEAALKRIAAGDPLAVVYPKDGTSAVPDGTALIKGAPHAENARRFIDFTVSREVQELLTETSFRRSVRTDVPPAEGLPAMSDIPLLDYDIDWAAEHRDGVLMTWAFYQGGEETP